MKYHFGNNTEYDYESIYLGLDSAYSHVIDVYVIAPNSYIGQKILDRVIGFFNQLEYNMDPEYRINVSLDHIHVFDSDDSLLEGIYQGLGGDRIAKLSGALTMFSGSNIMLMDFGTATTLNLANKNSEFIGGFVNLGLQARVEAVADKLKGFKNYAESKEFKQLISGTSLTEIFPNESTAKAVIEGAYREHLAMIQYYKNYALEKFNGENFISIATGGNAGVFSSEFDKNIDSRELLESFFDSLLLK